MEINNKQSIDFRQAIVLYLIGLELSNPELWKKACVILPIFLQTKEFANILNGLCISTEFIVLGEVDTAKLPDLKDYFTTLTNKLNTKK